MLSRLAAVHLVRVTSSDSVALPSIVPVSFIGVALCLVSRFSQRHVFREACACQYCTEMAVEARLQVQGVRVTNDERLTKARWCVLRYIITVVSSATCSPIIDACLNNAVGGLCNKSVKDRFAVCARSYGCCA